MTALIETRQWIYARRPAGRVGREHYDLVTTSLPADIAQGEVMLEARWFSVDPYMRIQQAERDTYDVPHPLGIAQRGGVVGQVIRSRDARFAIGDWVAGYTGWQTSAVAHGDALTRLDPDEAPVTTALGVLGMPGRTAWFGLMEAGKPKPGETLVVSGAAGAVGSLVVQFGLKAGCRVVGIAGGEAKCRYLIERLGAHAAIDYKAHRDVTALTAAVRIACPRGVDVYFDNVGGDITDVVIAQIARRARVVICGQISQYDGGLDVPPQGPRLLAHMLYQRASIQGILARDYTPRMDEMRRIVAPWVKAGEVVLHETIVEGFEQLPEALGSLSQGANLGKLLVRA